MKYYQQISCWIYSISENRNLKSKYFGAIVGLPQTVCKHLSYYKGHTTVAENHSHLLPWAGWLSLHNFKWNISAICANIYNMLATTQESDIQKSVFLPKAKRRQKTMQTFSWTCNIKQYFILDKFSQFLFLVIERSPSPIPCLHTDQL